MRKFMLLGAVSVLLGGCGWISTANNEAQKDSNTSAAAGTPQDPMVMDITTTGWDVSNLKEGDWVEYETKSGAYTAKSRMACVKIEGNTVWVEMSDGGNWVQLLGVDKSSRKTTKAYWGEKDKEAKEIKVTAAPTGGGTTNVNYKMKIKVKYSKDSVTVKGTAFDCEKTESSSETTMDGKTYTGKSSSWVSEKVPFRYYWDETTMNKKDPNIEYTTEGKPSVKGGLVKMSSESSGTTSEQNLIGWGTDAKMSVKLPASK